MKANKQQNKQSCLPNKRETGGILGMALLLILMNRSSVATTFDNDPTPLDRPDALEFEEENPPQLLPNLPELPPLPQDQLSSAARITVKQFNFEGNTKFSNEQLAEITQSYLGKEITAEQLQEAKNRITAHYIKEGFINSGAIIPDQKITDKSVTIQIIEGELFQVDVVGNERLRTSYVQKRLQGKPGDALNINDLQASLQLLQQNPRFRRIQAELGPGVKLGEGILKIDVTEAKPYKVLFSFNNHRSPSVGSYRGEVEGWHHNFTGLFGKANGIGDTVYFRYGMTNGLKDYSFRYTLPLNQYDTELSFNIERSDSEVVESPFNQLDVESEADTYAVTLSHPLVKKPNTYFNLGLRLEKRASKTFLLGRPFSFSQGVKNGESDLSVIRFSQDWLYRSRVEVIAARSSLNFGIDAMDSLINDDGSPDSEFFTWLGQFQYVRRLDFDFISSDWLKRSQIIFRTDYQWANEGLLPLEKISIGGASTVRGYRENQLTRDKGLISSLEWRIPLTKPSVGNNQSGEAGLVELASFFDYGKAWNAEGDTSEQDDIYSVGLGLRYSPYKFLHAQLYWGHALRDLPEPEDKDLQDSGIHFDIQLQVPFDF